MDNILVGFEDSSVLEKYAGAQRENPMHWKIANDRTVFLSHNDFGPLKSGYVLPKLADFGLAQRGNVEGHNTQPIQPDHYRAPEVIVGAYWTYSADIWNLGVLVCNGSYHP